MYTRALAHSLSLPQSLLNAIDILVYSSFGHLKIFYLSLNKIPVPFRAETRVGQYGSQAVIRNQVLALTLAHLHGAPLAYESRTSPFPHSQPPALHENQATQMLGRVKPT